MENQQNGNGASRNASSQNDWQNAENSNSENWQDDSVENSDLDLKSAEANGYGTNQETLYASSDDPENDSLDDDDDDDLVDDEDDSDDEEEPKKDWGSVDPLANQGGFSSDMDPSGPGSAV